MSRIATLLADLELPVAERKLAAWNNVPSVLGQRYKVDCDGRHIVWEDYGKCTEYGWQIDHITPQSLGGLSLHSNLRARHWRGNSGAGGLLGNLAKLPEGK